jgi:TldD protein
VNYPESFFAQRFGITQGDLQRYLAEALSRGGDYADLFFEYLATTSIAMDESIVKSATQGVSLGVGVRVLSGEKTGYAYTDNLEPERILHAARTAACIAQGPSTVESTGFIEADRRNLYPVLTAPADLPLAERVKLVERADAAARAEDGRVFQVQAAYADSLKHVLVATSEGVLNFDRQPMARMNVMVLVRQDDVSAPQRGYSGAGGRVALDFFLNEKTPEQIAREAVRQAIVQLDAVDTPAGEQTVVLAPGWPGVLLHEAVGHGLEADFNRKGTSAYSGRVGQRVASDLVTVVDDGTMHSRRGSLNLDDEGAITQRNVLIEDGILRGYLQDRLSSRILRSTATGNGRRESYQHIPMPRMTNTFMLAGQDDPHDIIRSVERGIYCVNFGGGQVDITNGNFVFSATEAYLIEGGRITAPVKDATLIGNGPEAMQRVSRVGHDLKLDEGIGVCGKEGQSVPVGVGMPTTRLDRITVGGTAA